jgi:Bacterial Ig domain
MNRAFLTVLAAMLTATLLAVAGGAVGSAAAASTRNHTLCAKRAKHSGGSRRSCGRRAQATISKRRRDIAPPTVTWKAPVSGATVSGSLEGPNCEVNASDNRGVGQVVFKIDGATLNTELSAPYNCGFDTRAYGDGAHTLTATAFDSSGNTATATTTVTISNATPGSETAPPPAPEPAPAPTDTTPPTVSWKAPLSGATVSGTLEGSGCEVSASDSAGVDHVVIKLDGSTLNTEIAAPWNCGFDTRSYGDGAHTLTATAYDATGNAATATATVNFANAPAPAPAPSPEPETGSSAWPSALVVGVDGGYAGWSSSETTERAQLSAAVTRHEFDPTEAVNGQDALVKAAAQIHTRIHALLGGNTLGTASHYKEWVVAFIRRYGLGGSFWKEHPELEEARYAIRTFELGNEPYFGAMTATEYAETVRPTLEAVKSLALPAEIVLPSRVYGTDTSWMDTLYQKIPNLNSYFYAFADHPYWYGHDPAQVSPAGPFQRLTQLRKRMNELGASAKPIFITEYGESTANCGSECVTESVQAEHLKEMLEAAVNRPELKIQMLCVFQLQDRGTNSTNRELQFGVLRQNGTQKPSYPIVQGYLQKYRG